MRITIALAALLVVGAATAGAGALSSVPDMRGSDTLRDLTRDLIDDVTNPPTTPAALDINYKGGGSGLGQQALVLSATGTATQTVAPMVRMFTTATNSASNVCTAVPASGSSPAYATKAEGVAFALDAISIVTSAVNGCSAAPAAAPNECSSSSTGLRFSGTVAGETIDDWREVLKIVYFGMTNANGTNGALRNCNSSVRQELLNNWSNLFQGSCTSCTDSTQGGPGLRHAFRLDESSGTTDTFIALIGGPAINFNVAGSPTGYARRTASSYFCNVEQQETTDVPIPPSSFPHRTIATWQDPQAAGRPLALPYLPEFQDHDPVRRTCAGIFAWFGANGPPTTQAAEEICGPKNDLGVVLAIQPPSVDATNAPTPYPTAYCQKNNFRYGPAPYNPITGQTTFCPNGAAPVGGRCLYPVSATLNFACINGRDNLPAPTGAAGTTLAQYSGQPTNLQGGRNPCAAGDTHPACAAGGYLSDGRVYNRFLLKGVYNDSLPVSQQTGIEFQKILRTNPQSPANTFLVGIVGANHRIHVTRSLQANPTSGTCSKASATAQLGCLTTASPCSVAYAGAVATDDVVSPGTLALRVNGVPPAEKCIQALETNVGAKYPLSRFLYVNSYRGFENVSASENAATDTELNLVRRFASIAPSKVRDYGFTPLVNGAFCQDFNEAAVCPGQFTSNSNSCFGNPSGIPSEGAHCGNAIVDPGEACDDGNVTNGDGCNSACSGP